ncbi:MAG TPA: hypothetical protein VFU69_04005, partial [Ktedonobacterales bacterium]|nr:hypothetical protein [Ktedonobacterales bacterium]
MTKAGYFAQDEREGNGSGAPYSRTFSQQPQALRCANCDIEIAWAPTISGSLAYCCPGCAQGGPCSCDYSE